VPKDAMPPNFAEKSSHKTAKFAKVFSLESFLLYGTSYNCTIICHMLYAFGNKPLD